MKRRHNMPLARDQQPQPRNALELPLDHPVKRAAARKPHPIYRTNTGIG
ncbi:MAG: hypothetical protein QGH33_05775 [Pirellulaceae bacterium]|nr:hypothetical protein [Pirellulaceae bacterium]